MGSIALGKRARRLRETAVEPPLKRSKRQSRSTVYGDENQDPADTLSEQALREEEEASGGVYGQSSVESTPSSRRSLLAPTIDIDKRQIETPLTPQTPRYRDALAKVPVTPRHRVMCPGKLSRRLTPQTPLTPAVSQTIYHQARQLFSRSSNPGQLVGRDEERSRLRTFLDRCGGSKPSGCIYVSGPPGTGKSAMVNEMAEEVSAGSSSVKKAYINCMSIKSSRDLYITLLSQLCHEPDVTKEDPVATLQTMFITRKKRTDVYLVVLDEIDHILTLDLESLYRLFEWSLQKSSRLVLIGIANALDLTDRFLPRLKSRNMRPELLPFLPYTAVQIKAIITERLRSLLPVGTATPDYVPFFHPAAIELCSRKVSSQTGDLRKTYEILRRALDLVEAEMKQRYEVEAKEKMLQMTPSKRPLGENINLASPRKKSPGKTLSASMAESLRSLTVENAPRVSIGHLNKVTAAAFSNGTSQRLKALNLQQTAALCSLMAIEKRNRAALAADPLTPSRTRITAPTIKILFDTYCLLCTQDSVLHPLSGSEFREVIGSLETLSLVTAVDGKTGSFTILQTPSKRGRKPIFGNAAGAGDEKRVASCVGEKELEASVEGLGADILRGILSGDALD